MAYIADFFSEQTQQNTDLKKYYVLLYTDIKKFQKKLKNVETVES